MPVFAKDIDAPAEEVELVTCKVTEYGNGLISTGTHHPTFGEQFYAEGETFQMAKEDALILAAKPRLYVTIVKEKAA